MFFIIKEKNKKALFSENTSLVQRQARSILDASSSRAPLCAESLTTPCSASAESLKINFLIFSFLVFLSLFYFNISFAYEPETTHAGLTDQIVQFYNLNFENDLTDNDKELLIRGSIEEDQPSLKVINHFYDPVRNIGINDSRTAKDWALQGLDEENSFSWHVALDKYAKGDRDGAMIALGHVLHLIEDMSVPDHTRNDPHIGVGPAGFFTGESPYEHWSSDNQNRESLSGLGQKILNAGFVPHKFFNLEKAFDFLANYSNNNFFSQDTIENSSFKYDKPLIFKIDGYYGLSTDILTGETFKVVRAVVLDNGEYVFSLHTDNDTSVLSEYFSRLSRQAILTGAGVVELFFREAEKARSAFLAEQKDKQKKLQEEAAAIVARLGGANRIALVREGLSDIFIKPVVSGATVATNSFKGGSKIALSASGNISSMVAFTAKSLASVTVQKISETLSYDRLYSFLKEKQDILSPLNQASLISSNVLNDSQNDQPDTALSAPVISSVVTQEDDLPDVVVTPSVSIDDVQTQLVLLGNSLSDFQNSLNTQIDQIVSSPQVAQNNNTSSVLAYNPPYGFIGFGQGGSNPTSPEPVISSSQSAQSSASTPAVEDEESSEMIVVNTDVTAPDVPIVTSPINNYITSSETVTFEGTAEASSIISTSLSSAASSVSSSGNWTIELSLQNGLNNISFFATDSSQNISSSTVFSVTRDNTAPSFSVSVDQCQGSISTNDDMCILISPDVDISLSSTDQDISYFSLDIDGVYSTTTAPSISSTISLGDDVLISASAIDTVGNRSATTTLSLFVDSMPVVINEVAWAGTSATRSEDEWIELYNRLDHDVSLDNFVLYSASDQTPYISLSGTISAGGFYLIERKNTGETDESSESPIKNITADLWTDFGGGLSNSGENLKLSVASTTVDEVSLCASWCGGSTSNYTSMERYDVDSSGETSNWSSNLTVIKNGTNTDNGIVYGTPKARNSVTHLINRGQDIASDLTLSSENSPYIMMNNTQLDISAGSTLSIDPGVVIKMLSSSRILVAGNIILSGTESSPVVITSFEDDTYGGDLNADGICGQDGGATCPSFGSWYGVELANTSSGSSFLNSILRYGGKDGNTSTVKKSLIYVDSVSPNISSTTVEYAEVYGLYLKNSSANVSNLTARFNQDDSQATGVYVLGGFPNISNSNISQNRFGLRNFSSGLVATNNTISNNSDLGFYSNGVISGYFSGNSLSSNSKDYIYLNGTITSANSTTTLKSNISPYFLDGTVTVASNSVLEIENGVSVKASNVGSTGKLSVSGRLVINGVNAGDVTFSSIFDTPSNTSWNGISLNSGSTSSIKGLTVKDAKEGLRYTTSDIYLQNVLLSNNKTAVKATGSYDVLMSENVLFENNETDKSPSGLW